MSARYDEVLGGEDKPKSVRLFVAAGVPDEHLESLERSTEVLRALELPARWVERSKQHVTLKFLGSTPVDRIEPVAESIAAVASSHDPFEGALAELGAWPSLRRARVLWAGLDDPTGGFVRLAGALEEALETLGYPREQRAFTPHLTIARFKAPKDLSGAPLSLGASGSPLFPVVCIALVRSRLHPSGARYETIGRFDLRGAAK